MVLLMLADSATASPIDMSSVTPFISSISSLGFAIWFAYYTVSVTLPSQQKESSDERSRMRAEFTEKIEKIEQEHATTIDKLVNEMKAQREAFDRWKSSAKG